jgi:type II secretory pathway pseudopilin PulG
VGGYRIFDSEGFTLFEVLAATVLAGVFLALCFVGFSQEKTRLFRAQQAQLAAKAVRHAIWTLDQQEEQGRQPTTIDLPPDMPGWHVTVERLPCQVYLGEGTEAAAVVPLADYMQRVIIIRSPDGRQYFQRRLIEKL